MGLAIVVLIVCVISLIALCNSDTPRTTVNKNTPPYTPPYIPPKQEDDEMAKARSRFKELEKKRKIKAEQEKAQLQQQRIDATLSKVQVPAQSLKWFVVDAAQDQISEAEKRIVTELKKYNVRWYREVAFESLKFEYGHARYDFLILTPKGKMHLIEYDGKAAHSTEQQKQRDHIKDEFCRVNKIPLTRYHSSHYYNLDIEIAKLMLHYNIPEKHKRS